ncbi:DUF2267 domain-containing protein [Pseudonocardia acidicola]|uniref:DUF2267 domain-containing protein n=1 Tax=Pseudonocardia acidicola TaxID=2724939 RepID=A0ABX1SJT2_9PSEU|nr:DUF2267 domain-containing protein [Pseudonocardia acidicola]NMI01235.1 DUF2267 domain-containing protein [Pseudonocardia acidicola]
MKHDEFIRRVSERAHVSAEQADTLGRAVLQTLAERITGGEADDLAAQLPPELQEPLRRPRKAPADPFGLDEFLRRVGERAGVDGELALRGTRAVLHTLRDTLPHKEFEDMVSQLPTEYRELLRVDHDEFVQKVARRAHVSVDQAQTLTRAVLQALAERISGGAAQDLAAQLPPELREPLQRPRDAHAEPIGLEEMLSRVGEGAGVDEDLARRAFRAVLLTVRDAVPRKEFEHVLGQLPKEVAKLL